MLMRMWLSDKSLDSVWLLFYAIETSRWSTDCDALPYTFKKNSKESVVGFLEVEKHFPFL